MAPPRELNTVEGLTLFGLATHATGRSWNSNKQKIKLKTWSVTLGWWREKPKATNTKHGV